MALVSSKGLRLVELSEELGLHKTTVLRLLRTLMSMHLVRRSADDRPGARDLLRLGVLVALPMALVMKQPDLGTALTYAAIAGAGVFFAGLRWQHAAVLGLLFVLVLPLGWTFLKDYQKAQPAQ